MADHRPIMTKAGLEALWADAAKEVAAKRDCPGHSFLNIRNDNPLLGKRCMHCGARFTIAEAAAYNRGLEHGKQFGSDCNCNPLENTGGGHRGDCPAYEPECTCYEVIGGHQSMCPYGVMLNRRKAT